MDIKKIIINYLLKNFAIIGIAIVSMLLYGLSFRGNPGNPTPQQVEYELNSAGQAFETSQERSRWALILSLYHDKSFAIDNYASMGTPDIGYIQGHFYSFFPPGMSVVAMPFYSLGLAVGHSQLFVFAMPIFFALGTMILIYKFCNRLRVSTSVAILAALGFGFATSAWGYSVTIFAHILSAFFIVLGLYLTVFDDGKSRLRVAIAWVIYAILVYMDFPNLFLYAPVAIAIALRAFSVGLKTSNLYSIKIKASYIFPVFVFVGAMLLYGYYNYVHFGHPLYLSNTIPRVRDLKNIVDSVPEQFKNAGQSLNTRNILNGLYTFTISQDRGLLIYSPSVLLFVFGIRYFAKKRRVAKVLLVAIPFTCLVLYSMFGDPYGGWAFGSRYMVAVMPELLILAGVGLSHLYKKFLVKVIYSVVFIYSTGMALLAALTTNVVPPSVEAEPLGLESTFMVNWNMLREGALNSFFYNYILNRSIPAIGYYVIIFLVLAVLFSFLIWSSRLNTNQRLAK